jgi:glycosyltransferase 2 family protein
MRSLPIAPEPSMLRPLRAVARFCQNKIGWNRIGFLISVAIIGIAAVVLYRTLHDINVDEVVQALHAKELRHIVAAGLFVAAGYFTLTFYDLFALRAIGRKKIPYRIAALAGFTSYSIGHNIGATVFTGGAVRYRVYSASGLDAIEVAKICFVAGLTFWLGNAAVLGLGVTLDPIAASAIDQFPLWLNRCIGVVILLVLLSYVGWVWSAPRKLGRGGWQVRLPNGPSTLLQICIGIVDLACCALAMYMVLPDEPNIGFVSLAVIFVTATMLGFASHAPGGLGVFDATMLVALWQFDKEDLLAGLLLFRLLYYIMPFVLALVMLGIREAIIYVRAPGPLSPPQTVETSGPIRSELETRDKAKR